MGCIVGRYIPFFSFLVEGKARLVEYTIHLVEHYLGVCLISLFHHVATL